MARINTNISSVIAQSNLGRTQKELDIRLERLATGLRINRGKDDPAGLIISERVRSDINGVQQGMKNAQRASSMISTTEASLAEVNDLLNSIKALMVEAANTGGNSQAERDANQLQIDSAIDSITRISNTASFGGLRLLDGSLDYTLSSVRASAITSVQINNASFVNAANLQVEVDVVASAQTGALYYNGNTTPTGVTLSAMTLRVAGPAGVQVLTIASGQPLNKVVQAVNNLTSLTGVRASLINGDVNSGMTFSSVDYGSGAFVSVNRIGGPQDPSNDSFQLYRFGDDQPIVDSDPFPWASLVGSGAMVTASRDTGRDVSALVNGILASGNGLKVSMNSGALGLELLLSEGAATRPASAATSFYVTGGGALFQLGPEITALQQSGMGIPSVSAANLGATLSNGVVEYLTSLKRGQGNSIAENVASNDFTVADAILERSINQVTSLRGRLGAFERNVLDTNVRSLQAAFENLTASDSQIRDADFAYETSRLTRAQILSSAGTSTLALANQQSQQVLQLLG